VTVAVIGWALLGLSAIGSVYTIASAVLVARFFARKGVAAPTREPVTLLKPLHGPEPRLGENLGTFLRQDEAGAIQMVCGVARAEDPAIAVVEGLGGAQVDLVLDPARHGASAKISNLINMMPAAEHPTLILSDSDMVAPGDYVASVVAALAPADVGAVTCLYRGRGDAGFWSRLGAAGLSYQFLPGALFGAVTGLAHPCMGSTIALRRETLDRIGGFARFADVLADDHAIGAEVRALGLRVVIPPMLVTHASAERSFRELWRHEVRWAATVLGVAPAGHAGSVVGMPLPLALFGVAAMPAAPIAWASLGLAFLSRAALKKSVDRAAGAVTGSLLLLPIRDLLTFVVFVASFFARSIDWRGGTLKMTQHGRIEAVAETHL
jgi:ceramide glucosyltransferase